MISLVRNWLFKRRAHRFAAIMLVRLQNEGLEAVAIDMVQHGLMVEKSVDGSYTARTPEGEVLIRFGRSPIRPNSG